MKTYSHGRSTIFSVYFNNYYTLKSREEQERLRWGDFGIKENLHNKNEDVVDKGCCALQ